MEESFYSNIPKNTSEILSIMYKKVAFCFTPIPYDMDFWLSTYQIILFGLGLPVYFP